MAAALQVLKAMVVAKLLHELKQFMTSFQTLINVPTRQKINLDESIEIQTAVQQVEQVLGNRGQYSYVLQVPNHWIRVMVEGEDTQETQSLAELIAEAVQSCLNETIDFTILYR